MATPDYAASLAFLRLLYPQGPWVLTAIHPERKSDTGDADTRTRTFTQEQEAYLLSWLEEHGAEWNLYYQVNPPTGPVNGKKAYRHQIKEMAYLHLDMDRQPNESIEVANARMIELMRNPPFGLPPATGCVSSGGGGVNAQWALEVPVPVEGETAEERTESANKLAAYNDAIRLLFAADPCHDIGRILRLPGTLNRPNAKKREKYGRTEPTLAKLEFWNPENVYPLSKFMAAAPVSAGGSAVAAGHEVQISSNVAPVLDLGELGAVAEDVLETIRTGQPPARLGEKFVGDRSRTLFWVCCELARADTPTNKISDDKIYSILMDKRWGISESVLDKKGGADRYARRQIKRGRDFAECPALEELNSRYAVIANFGGECVAVEEINGELVPISLGAIKNFYQNRTIPIGKRKYRGEEKAMEAPLGQWWLQHPKRHQYRYLEFNPRGDSPGDVLNTWKGFAITPAPGDWSLFRGHILDNICSGDQTCYDYLIRWLARMVQKPWEPGHVAIVLKGGQGTGKGWGFAHIIGSLFAQGHYMHLSESDHLLGKFNHHLENKVYLFADEAFFAGDKANTGKLKTLITEPRISIERKGYDVKDAPNYLHIIIASNNDWVIPAEPDERRFLALNVADHGQKQNPAYFRAMKAQLDAGGLAGFLHDLRNLDLEGFDPRKYPQTQELREQKMRSFKSEVEWWHHKLDSGYLVLNRAWERPVLCEELQTDYFDYCKQRNIKAVGPVVLGRFLRQATPEVAGKRLRFQQRSDDGSKPPMYQFAQLRACRAHFDTVYGGPFPWTETDERDTGEHPDPPEPELSF